MSSERLNLFLFALVISVLSSFLFVNAEMNEDKLIECRYLNEVRTNLTFCCRYPILVIWKWQYNICLQNCSGTPKTEVSCCILPCIYKSIGVLVPIDNELEKLKIDHNGLIYSFLLSIGNDTIWSNVLEHSTKNCFDQFDGANEGYYCNAIPHELYAIVDCAYIENFIRCPTYNPHERCKDTMRFVEKCLRGDD